MTALTMLREGIERGVGNCNEAARRLNVTPSMLSKILSGERNLAPDLKPRVAKMHPLAGLAVALQATGYRIFEYIRGDRHPQTMIRRVEKEDAEADEALKKIAMLIIDAEGPEDLTEEARRELFQAGRELCDRIRADLNTVIELEDRYHLGLLEYMTGEKEKSLVAETRAICKTS